MDMDGPTLKMFEIHLNVRELGVGNFFLERIEQFFAEIPIFKHLHASYVNNVAMMNLLYERKYTSLDWPLNEEFTKEIKRIPIKKLC